MIDSSLNPEVASSQNIEFKPAGFWIRFLAVIIDALVLWVITFPVSLLIGLLSLAFGFAASGESATETFSGPVFLLQIISYVISGVIWIAYFAYFYQKKGATPGKLLFGMRVLDSSTGANLTLKQAILREFLARLLSGLLLLGIGYFIAAFREDRKALHDLLAGTQVLKIKN